jgi:hypothetical protein
MPDTGPGPLTDVKVPPFTSVAGCADWVVMVMGRSSTFHGNGEALELALELPLVDGAIPYGSGQSYSPLAVDVMIIELLNLSLALRVCSSDELLDVRGVVESERGNAAPE